MKATQEEAKPVFRPVTITLETQEEVDAVHTLFNHVGVSRSVGLPYEVYNITEPYRNRENCVDKHNKLCNFVNRRQS